MNNHPGNPQGNPQPHQGQPYPGQQPGQPPMGPPPMGQPAPQAQLPYGYQPGQQPPPPGQYPQQPPHPGQQQPPPGQYPPTRQQPPVPNMGGHPGPQVQWPPQAPYYPGPQQQMQPPGYYPPYPPQQPKKGGTGKVLGLFAAIVILVASIFGGGLASGWRPFDSSGDSAVVDAGPVEPAEGDIPHPGEDSTVEERAEYFEEQAQLRLDAHGESLVVGSLEGWLAAFEPTLHDQMTSRFETLSEMETSQFEYHITAGPYEDTSQAVDQYDIDVSVSYCFVVPEGECMPTDAAFSTTWSEADAGFVMTDIEESGPSTRGPHPWESDDLIAATGERTVVAVPSRMEEHLDYALQEAEAAAEEVDQYALWEPVDRYVLYMAGDEELERWFGGEIDDGVVGYALPLEGTVDGVRDLSTMPTVVAVDRLGWGDEFVSTVRHELGHVATLHGADTHRNFEETWWMVEGIAEFIDFEGDLSQYPRLAHVSEYLGEGGCAGTIPPPTLDGSDISGSASYGCAFFGVNYMIEEYGHDEFMDWFGESVRGGIPPDIAAQDVYGKSYSEIMAEITEYIEETV